MTACSISLPAVFAFSVMALLRGILFSIAASAENSPVPTVIVIFMVPTTID
jgi:hypothetical protein